MPKWRWNEREEVQKIKMRALEREPIERRKGERERVRARKARQSAGDKGRERGAGSDACVKGEGAANLKKSGREGRE